MIRHEASILDKDPDQVTAKWGWFLALGIALVILGLAAIAFPLYGSLAGTRVFAWLMIFSGIVAATHAAGVRGWGGVAFQVLIAAVYIIGGLWLLTHMLPGVLTLTVVLIAVLFVQGVFSTVEAVQLRPTEGWKWMLSSGIASIILGFMLWQRFPSSALWAIGLLFGLSLVINGWSFISLALGYRGQPVEAQR